MKQCGRCGEVKQIELFAKRNKSLDGRSAWCKSCFKEYDRDRYQNGDKDRKERNKAKVVNRNKALLWSYLSTHPCVDCGNNDARVLEFDHRDELTKIRNVTDMFYLSWAKVQKEIDKCDVRCANCHRIRTQEQFGTWRFYQGVGQPGQPA